MTSDVPPSSWTGLFRRVEHLAEVVWRFKRVGEESELSHMGCVEAWQRRHTRSSSFCVGVWFVGVIIFCLAMCDPFCGVGAACPLGRARQR
jgi:hypothetical protein